MADEMTLEDLAGQITEVARGLRELRDEVREQGDALRDFRGGLREQGDALRAEFREQGEALRTDLRREVRNEIDGLKTHMDLRFEETHRLIRLSLEGQAIQQESVARRFDEADRKLDEQTDLLKLVHVNTTKRVSRVERRR